MTGQCKRKSEKIQLKLTTEQHSNSLTAQVEKNSQEYQIEAG